MPALRRPLQTMAAGFFAVGHDTFVRACELGLNPAAAFLVLARGTGGDNTTTKCSAEAGAERLGVRWTTAKAAILKLIEAAVITVEQASTRPRYALAKEGTLIWLPNAIIDGTGTGTPPVAQVRQAQDMMAL